MKYSIIILSATILLSSCLVSKKKYETLVSSHEQLQSEHDTLKSAVEAAKNKKIDLNNENSKIGYSLGVTIGSSLKSNGLKQIDSAAFASALGDVFGERKTKISPQEAQHTLQSYFEVLQNKMIEEQSAAGAKFLAENSMKEGVIVLPSGLQYKVIKEGTGEKPKVTDEVKVHYHGTLIDGTVFDSSIESGEPASFTLNGVIRGWVEGLQLMPVGSKWRLFIPQNLAYGAKGNGPIKPYSALIFDIELIDIIK